MSEGLVVSISSVLARIKNVLTQTMDLSGIWIQGEISNLTKHRSGHYYFSLKDKSGEMSCVMFSSYVSKLHFDVQEGMSVFVSGQVNVYEQRGSLQLVIRQMKMDGLGDLYLEFERRKEALLKAGYFEPSHKKLKPSYVENIGIITASQAAALQDVLMTIKKRWPMMKITLYPSYVQGNLAPSSLIRSLKKADQAKHDALLIVRGGGSFEDLFCFNDVELVKTIYNLNTYTVSGVGHEVDTTLCDLVCDQRCVTPTAAAQWVSLDQYEVLKQLSQMQNMLIVRMQNILDKNQTLYLHYKNNPYLKDPKSWIIEKQLKLDGYTNQLEHAYESTKMKMQQIVSYEDKLRFLMQKRIEKSKQELNAYPSLFQMRFEKKIEQTKHELQKNYVLLDAYSPLKSLSRGYSISKQNNHVLKSIEDVQTNELMMTQLQDGLIISKVIEKKGE